MEIFKDMKLGDWGALISIIAILGGGLIKGISILLRGLLTQKEKDILIACSKNGEVRILHVDAIGDWVRADRKDFLYQENPSHTAQYLDAFYMLKKRGLIIQEGGLLYRLTGKGFNFAKKYAKNSD